MAPRYSRGISKSSKKKIDRSIGNKSEWSSWMQGADPEWFHSPAAKALARAYGDFLPQWLIQSSPWTEITPARFQALRKLLMKISVAQCAAYLQVTCYQVNAWEKGKQPIPFAAYETLRLQVGTNIYRLSDRVWDGWFIEKQSGALVSPDNGKITVLPNEINSLLHTYSRLSSLEVTCTQQAKRIDELEAENAALRGQDKVRAVTAELEDIQQTIAHLLGGLKTAEILQFPIAEHSARATVGA